ncbi:MAG: SpoIIE family protein phosphatase [Armatimonadetes bacterium]|jgi:GAF domain-containing protein|nr:SpoIIE family protein phosphatase [Armatimonadota bacterium]
MLNGIAQAGDGTPPDDRQSILVALSNLSKLLGATEADTTFTTVAETAATLLRVERLVIFLKRDGEAVSVVGTSGAVDDASFALGARQAAEEALMETGPVMLTNVAAEKSVAARAFARSGVASALCVPLRVGRANVGAIVAASDTLRTFSSSDVELLHTVASQTALKAWRDAPESQTQDKAELIRLAQRKIQELSLINQVSGAVSSTLDLDRLLDIALEQSMLAVEADTGSLMLVHEETGRLEIAAARGLSQRTVQNTSQQIGTSVAGWVALHGESVLVSNAHTDSRFSMPFYRDDITSAASVPLKTKTEVIGVLNVNTTRPDHMFDERDLALLGTVANELASAIENARLYARVNRRTKQLDSLLSVSKTVTSTLNIDELMRRLTDEVTKLFALDACVLILLDDLSGRLRLGYGAGIKTRRRYAYYDLASPLAAQVVKTRSRLVIKDIRNPGKYVTEISEREGLRSAVCVPFKNAGKLVGIAVGFTRDVRVFRKSQREIMGPLGELAGVAIHNARVYRQKYKMAEILTQRLMPSTIPGIEGLDIGHKFMPVHEVGGDYYDFLKVGPDEVGIVMADVCGHDVEAAEYTSMGKHVIRAYAREHSSPARVLGNTNDLICEDTSAEVFISAFYGVIDLKNRKLRYANAGCERPIVYRPGEAKASRLESDGMLLGIQAQTSFGEREIDLKTGDIITLFTDGLTEAGVDKDRFGDDRVVSAIAESARFSAQEIADSISYSLSDFVRGQMADDVAIVVIKIV